MGARFCTTSQIDCFQQFFSSTSDQDLPSSDADDDVPHFPGSKSKFTDKLEFVDAEEEGLIPVYRVMNRNGEVTDKQNEPTV